MIDNVLKQEIDNYNQKLAQKYDTLGVKRINKAEYDKTYIGFVSDKIEKADGTYRWRIQTNGIAYDILPEMCNITEVGQNVRLHIPNHKYHEKYAEVIPDNVKCTNVDISDNELVFSYDDDTTETVQVTRDNSNRITSFSIGDKKIEVNWNV